MKMKIDNKVAKFADNAWSELCDAVEQFGTYSYHDKGASEIMHLSPLLNQLKGMSVKEVGDSLCALLEKEHKKFDAETLVQDLVLSLDSEEWFDELLDNYPDLAEFY